MAPEWPPRLIAVNLRVEPSGILKCAVEIIEAPEHKRLRMLWAVDSAPEGYRPVCEGVAYLQETGEEIPMGSYDAFPISLGNMRYRWQEGLSPMIPWQMFIMILPTGQTLIEPQPQPVSAKEFKERIALLWIFEGDERGRTTMEWGLKTFDGDLSSEVERINRIYGSGEVSPASTIDVDSFANSNRVFISYSRNDSEWLERLQVHLKPLERIGTIVRWDDTLIKPGAKWQEELNRVLESAKVAVLLVSADFLASDFIAENELPPLLAAAEEKGTRILPVVVSPCLIERSETLSQFQAVNPPSQSLATMPRAQQEETLVKVTEAIEDALRS
jgi:hypothetical protein